jgi:hypothetical protein
MAVQTPVMVRFPRDYELVARVKARFLEEVFAKTNDIGDPWWRNRGVDCLKETRSTMVGDVVVSPSQKVYHFVGRGWMCVHDPALGQALEQARAQAQEQKSTRVPERKPTVEQTQGLEEKPKLMH